MIYILYICIHLNVCDTIKLVMYLYTDERQHITQSKQSIVFSLHEFASLSKASHTENIVSIHNRITTVPLNMRILNNP